MEVADVPFVAVILVVVVWGASNGVAVVETPFVRGVWQVVSNSNFRTAVTFCAVVATDTDVAAADGVEVLVVAPVAPTAAVGV